MTQIIKYFAGTGRRNLVNYKLRNLALQSTQMTQNIMLNHVRRYVLNY